MKSVPQDQVLAPLLSLSLAQANWLHNGVRRRMLQAFPFSKLRARDYRKRLSAFSPPAISPKQNISSLFNSAGALMLSREDMSLLFGADLVPLCDQARAVLSDGPLFRLENEAALATCPDFYRLGLSPTILDLAEACLGLDCLYLGATLKRERADGRVAGTRQWHMDIEDEKLVRILVYLAPVAPDGGPFEYFPRAISQTIRTALHYRSGYIDDARMALMAPNVQPQQCTGEAGDAIIFDGAGVFHRGGTPLGQDRYSITFAYCSRQPLELRHSARLPRALHRHFLSTLSERQCGAIPPPRPF
jgi:hypothetical protein